MKFKARMFTVLAATLLASTIATAAEETVGASQTDGCRCNRVDEIMGAPDLSRSLFSGGNDDENCF